MVLEKVGRSITSRWLVTDYLKYQCSVFKSSSSQIAFSIVIIAFLPSISEIVNSDLDFLSTPRLVG